jgi:hypothetical protein
MVSRTRSTQPLELGRLARMKRCPGADARDAVAEVLGAELGAVPRS